MADPIATVVIPNYNGIRHLPTLLESLEAQTDSRFTVTIVDDVSTDDSVAYLRKQWPQVRLVCNERNIGFAGSCNAGLRSATTPFVILLNNDTHVDPDWLAEGLRPFEREEIAAVASLVLLADPPHLIDTAGDVYSVVGGAQKRNHLHGRETIDSLDGDCFSPCGASAFYRRDVIEKLGYLDEGFESYYEDVDLGFRLAWAGYRCAFAPRSICYHHLSSSYNPRGWRYHYNSARNAEIVWRSHMPPRLRRKYFFSHLCFLLLQGLNKLRQGCFRPYLAGKWSVRRHRRRILEKREENRKFARIGDDEIESRLVRNWWALHVTSRWTGTHRSGHRT
ncbi:MAG: glycosyltransferase family 2 protein [Phycisphaerales bacterium]|nr:glycosyltransferase family 2 protein [Phycisphaerales bacterium]